MHPGFDIDDAQQQKKYPEWWTEERQRSFTTNINGDVPELKPAFYSPSAFSVRLFEDSRPSQNVSHCCAFLTSSLTFGRVPSIPLPLPPTFTATFSLTSLSPAYSSLISGSD
jgi:hypothetical protein